MSTAYLEKLKQSIVRFAEALAAERNSLNRDAAIQRFEFTTELAWKTIQKFLREQELDCRSPKECLQKAFEIGLVTDDPGWSQMFSDRNLTSHTYDEETADAVYTRLPGYLPLFDGLYKKLAARLTENLS